MFCAKLKSQWQMIWTELSMVMLCAKLKSQWQIIWRELSMAYCQIFNFHFEYNSFQYSWHIRHHLSMKTEYDYLNGWIKKTITYTKISPKMMNPRDTAGERRRRRQCHSWKHINGKKKQWCPLHVNWWFGRLSALLCRWQWHCCALYCCFVLTGDSVSFFYTCHCQFSFSWFS